MSIEAMSWALSAPFGGTKKLVLVGLGNHASAEFDEARPAIGRLEEYAHCDRRTVQRTLRWLESEGWVEKTGEHPIQGRKDRAVNVYRLCSERGGDLPPRSSSGAASRAERGGITGPSGAAPVPPEPSLEPSREPSGDAGAGDQVSLVVPEDRVDAFLAFYRTTVEAAQGEALPRFSKAARSAAREILEKHPASSEVAAVLRFGLADHRWYADKILTVPKFRDAYPKLRAKWVGAVAGRAKAEEIRAERGAQEVPAARSVSYEGDRVRIS